MNEKDPTETAGEASVPTPPAPALPAFGPNADLFSCMYYGRSNSIGIREKFGTKKQIFGFGGKKEPRKSQAELRAIAKVIIGDLNNGVSKAECLIKARNLVMSA